MLALRLNAHGRLVTPGWLTPTMVFDEVDAGIGGAAAPRGGRGAGPTSVPTHAGHGRDASRAGRRAGDDAGGRDQARRRTSDDGDGGRSSTETSASTKLARMLSGSTAGDAARRHALELLRS